MKKSETIRVVELIKDVLILLLTCSALYLAAQTPLAAPLGELFREEGNPALPGRGHSAERGSGALPLAMVVNLPGESGLPGGKNMPEPAESVRCGLLYNQTACQELFQRVAGPLSEALSSAGTPEPVSRRQWERALTTALGVYMDFQGEVPLPVLAGWLSGGDTRLTATVRRLVLTVGEDGVELYYRDERDGQCYRCRDQVADPYLLAEALSGLTDNGAFYAFESDLYRKLDPDTLLMPSAPVPRTYSVSNPVTGGKAALEALVQDLGFSLNSTSFYSTDEQVARSGDNSVRLSAQGVAQYEGNEGGGMFPVLRQGEAGAMFDAVETCRQLALSALGPRCGEARLYLISVIEVEGGWEIDFGYSLNGVPVLLERGYAARFLVKGERIVQFSLCLRSYTDAGTTALVLPPKQGAAALASRGLEGSELLLTYSDSGGDTVSAGWSARDNTAGEG